MNHGICTPRLRLVVFAEISEERDQSTHSRGVGGTYVAFRIADVHAVAGLNAEQCGRVQQRRRMKLTLRQGIATHDAVGPRRVASPRAAVR